MIYFQNSTGDYSILGSSEQVAALFAALSKAQNEFKPLRKTQKVEYSNVRYNYAGAADVEGATKDALCANGLAITQSLQGWSLVTTLAHKSGGAIVSISSIDVPDSAAQSNKGRSYGQLRAGAFTMERRAAVCAILGVVADDDDDDANRNASTSAPNATNDAPKKVYTKVKIAEAVDLHKRTSGRETDDKKSGNTVIWWDGNKGNEVLLTEIPKEHLAQAVTFLSERGIKVTR